ncbi:MAG: CapA family protein [Pirellulales bacterium]|nr:CapA family protein [Pirellulales bacterium]
MPGVAAESLVISMFLAGDVMTGRGIDQILPHPLPPTLYEPVVRDARGYVMLAERTHGPIPRPADFAYIWGDALPALERARPDVKIVNLETSITCSETPWPDKEIHYRMHPRNVPCLTAAGIDCCALANNHVLDWDRAGLAETLSVLDAAGVAHAGAGRTAAEAAAPAVLEVRGKGRVLVFGMGTASSGIPAEWAAAADRPGVNFLEDLSDATIQRVANSVQQAKQPEDLVVVSIHWGSNWGYGIPAEQMRLAHLLIDVGADVIHGHSSHHVRTVEVYRDRLILYGCGDFITDYEGISGYEQFRGDLALMYLIQLEARTGRLHAARLVPFRSHRLQLRRASEEDARWLCELLNRLGQPSGTRFTLAPDQSLLLDH